VLLYFNNRTAATILAENNISTSLLMNAGDWKNQKISQTYIDNSLNIKRTISNYFEK